VSLGEVIRVEAADGRNEFTPRRDSSAGGEDLLDVRDRVRILDRRVVRDHAGGGRGGSLSKRVVDAPMDDADSARLRAVPKVELHLHLEGAIPHHALFSLIQKYGGDPAVRGAADIAARFRFRDFPHFIAMWVWKNGFLRPTRISP
jgi:hypothetical protein